MSPGPSVTASAPGLGPGRRNQRLFAGREVGAAAQLPLFGSSGPGRDDGPGPIMLRPADHHHHGSGLRLALTVMSPHRGSKRLRAACPATGPRARASEAAPSPRPPAVAASSGRCTGVTGRPGPGTGRGFKLQPQPAQAQPGCPECGHPVISSSLECCSMLHNILNSGSLHWQASGMLQCSFTDNAAPFQV